MARWGPISSHSAAAPQLVRKLKTDPCQRASSGKRRTMMARATSRYGGSPKSRAEFNHESIHDPADDVIFRSKILAASYHPKTRTTWSTASSHDSIVGLSRTIPTSPGTYASSVYRPAVTGVQVVHESGSPSRVVPIPASPPHPVAGGPVVGTHTVRAVYSDAYESLRLGHPPAVLEEILRFRPGLARQCDSNGVTLLHWACYYCSVAPIFELLLRVNPDAARRPSQNDGCLPLHVAASWGCPVTIIALLFSAFPESVNVADIWGNLPADKAIQMGHNDIVPLLTPTDGRPFAHRPGPSRRVLRDDLEESRVQVSESSSAVRVPEPLEHTHGHASTIVDGESVPWRQHSNGTLGSSDLNSPQQRSNPIQSTGEDSMRATRRSGDEATGVAASYRANDRSVSENKELRLELSVQRTAISHRLARLEHSDSISAAERDNLQCALSAEKRRADRLQRQLDRALHSTDGRADTCDSEPPSSEKMARGGSIGVADQSLADAFELSQAVDGAFLLLCLIGDSFP